MHNKNKFARIFKICVPLFSKDCEPFYNIQYKICHTFLKLSVSFDEVPFLMVCGYSCKSKFISCII